MANNYTWVINALDCVPLIDGQPNVVSSVHWILNATDGTHYGSVYGTQSLVYKTKASFIDYSSLTELDVISWVQDNMGKDKILELELMLDAQIANLANPPIVSKPLPWLGA
jgi:hypothetical protein